MYVKLDGNTALYPGAAVTGKINEAARHTNLFGWFSQGAVDVGLTIANWQWYRIPAPVVFPLSVFLDNEPLYKSPVGSISSVKQDWLRAKSTGQVRNWIPVGTQMFGISDVDPSGGRQLQVWGVTTPPLLVNSDDTLTLEDEYADLITELAWMTLVLREGGKPFTDAAQSYSGWMKRIRKLQKFERAVNPKFWIEAESKSAPGGKA